MLFCSVIVFMIFLSYAATPDGFSRAASMTPMASSADVARFALLQRSRRVVMSAVAVANSTHPSPVLPAAQRSPPPSAVADVTDATCHARDNTDYMGESAPVWGLGTPGFHLRSAAECCEACQAHAKACGKGPQSRTASWWPARPELRCGAAPGCNLWVFCPEEQCFAFDIHVHKRGECWLKQQTRFDQLGANVTSPKDPHEGHTRFPESMRRSPRQIWPWAVDVKIWPGGIPEKIPWISGVLAPANAVVRSAPADDPWRKRWCDKHGAQYGACDAPVS